MYGPALIARQALAAANFAQMIGVVVRFGVAVVLLFIGAGLLGLVIGQVAGEAATFVSQTLSYRRRYPGQSFALKLSEGSLMRSMLAFGAQQMLTNVASRLVYSTDQLIVGKVSGLGAAAVYYTTQMPGFVLIQALWTLTDNSAPALNELYARGDHASVRRALLQLMKYSALLAIGAAGGILLFEKSVVTHWVGAAQYAGDLMTGSLAAFAFFSIMNHALALVLLVYGRVQILARSAFAMAVVNVALSVALAYRIGVQGVMLASAVTEVLLFIVLAVAAGRVAAIDFGLAGSEIGRPVSRLVLSLAPVTVALFLVTTAPDLLMTAAAAVVYTAVWCGAAWFFGLTPPERTQVGLLFARLAGRTASA
jgi:O-antigen/teichoic acid export membrane protein